LKAATEYRGILPELVAYRTISLIRAARMSVEIELEAQQQPRFRIGAAQVIERRRHRQAQGNAGQSALSGLHATAP
jgi:hypothetical protein